MKKREKKPQNNKTVTKNVTPKSGKSPSDPSRRQLLKKGWSLALTALLFPLAGKSAGCMGEEWDYSDWVNDSPGWDNWSDYADYSDWTTGRHLE